MAVKFDMTKDLAPEYLVTVRIVGIKKWYVRLWMATKLIKLAATIMNVGIKIEEKPYYAADL